MTFTSLLTALLLAFPIQESTRTLDKPGEHFKHLTVDTVDRWLLDGIDGEVLRVDIRSDNFDPVLELVRLDAGGRITEVLVPEVDDDGNTSNMLLRLEKGGPIAILVHGPQNRGGGNYRLYVERLRSQLLPAGAEYLTGRLDAMGNAHVRVAAEAGDTLVPRGPGVVEVLDPKGFSIGNWRGCYEVERSGEHYLRVRGEPKAPFRVGVAEVPRRKLEPGAPVEATVDSQGLDEWTFETQAGGMQLIELVGVGLETRIVQDGDPPGRAIDEGPPHRWLATHSKGATWRSALVARIASGQRIQVRSSSDRPTPYRLAVRDPSVALEPGAPTESRLPVGGSHYWSFDAEPGQVLRASAASEAFDPVLRLHDATGALIIEADDAGGGLRASHSWLVTGRGRIYAEVLSYGNGGGGSYTIAMTSLDVATIAVGERKESALVEGERAYWHLEVGDEEQLLVLANSSDFDPGLQVYDPDGVMRWRAWSARQEGGVLLNLYRPGAGRYTLVLQGRGSGGTYSLRILDPSR